MHFDRFLQSLRLASQSTSLYTREAVEVSSVMQRPTIGLLWILGDDVILTIELVDGCLRTAEDVCPYVIKSMEYCVFGGYVVVF